MISQKALEEFKNIWKEEYGEEISNEFALEQAIRTLTFFDAIYKPIKKSWIREFNNKDGGQQKPNRNYETNR